MAGMPNLRIIYSNTVSQATLTASSTAGALAAANMLNDRKASVHRSVGTTVAYTLKWATPQHVGGVALPATNLSPKALIRVRLFADEAMTDLVADTGVRKACPTTSLGLYNWDAPIDARAFAFGGASKVAAWFSSQPQTVRACSIVIEDLDNSAGYIDCSRLVVGPFWEAPKNADYGATAGVSDLSKVVRSDSGDAMVVRGPMFETMSLPMSELTETARATLAKIVRSYGASQNLFFSLLPEAPVADVPVTLEDGSPLTLGSPLEALSFGDLALEFGGGAVGADTSGADVFVQGEASAEHDHMIYGRRASGPFRFDFFNSFSASIEIESW